MSLEPAKIVFEPGESNEESDPRLIAGRLVRGRSGRSVTFRAAPLTPLPPSAIAPANIARLLAAAYWVREQIDVGEFRDLADAARRFGITRARMTQVVDLTLLAPEIQEWALSLEGPGGRCTVTERQLRDVLSHVNWDRQRLKLAGASLLPVT